MKPEFVPIRAAIAGGLRCKSQPQKQEVADPKPAGGFLPISAQPPASATAASSHGEPTITLERDGDRVTRILVHCPCGNAIELVCEY